MLRFAALPVSNIHPANHGALRRLSCTICIPHTIHPTHRPERSRSYSAFCIPNLSPSLITALAIILVPQIPRTMRESLSQTLCLHHAVPHVSSDRSKNAHLFSNHMLPLGFILIPAVVSLLTTFRYSDERQSPNRSNTCFTELARCPPLC